ncbi:unnamed protein product [Urochloa humidicola]
MAPPRLRGPELRPMGLLAADAAKEKASSDPPPPPPPSCPTPPPDLSLPSPPRVVCCRWRTPAVSPMFLDACARVPSRDSWEGTSMSTSPQVATPSWPPPPSTPSPPGRHCGRWSLAMGA